MESTEIVVSDLMHTNNKLQQPNKEVLTMIQQANGGSYKASYLQVSKKCEVVLQKLGVEKGGQEVQKLWLAIKC